MGGCTRDHGAVPEHSGLRSPAIHDGPQAGDRLSERLEGWGSGIPVLKVRSFNRWGARHEARAISFSGGGSCRSLPPLRAKEREISASKSWIWPIRARTNFW